MSNRDKQNKTKVIKVRPLHEFKKEEKDAAINDLTEPISLQLQIEQAKQQLHSVEKQREKLISELHEEIGREKEEWEKLKQEEMERIQKEGYESGFQAGKQESLAQYSHLIDEANALTERATDEYYEKIKQYESTVIQLAMQVSEKILNDKLLDEPKSFVPIVKAAIQDLKENYSYSIYLHPDNYDIVLNQKEELYELVDEKSTISLYIDNEIDVNSCLIEHSSGRIDASVDTQLKEIKRALTQLMETNE